MSLKEGNTMNMANLNAEKNKILLESGTNEVEMLEFFVGQQYYAVNVAKVQTLVQYDSAQVTDMPELQSQVKHMIKIHEQIIPMVKLSDILHIQSDESIARKIVILLSFNSIRVAILVDGVVSIHRMSWNDFTPISGYIAQSNDTVVLGSFRSKEKDIVVLDFEKIMANFFPESNIEEIYNSTDIKENKTRENMKIVNVDDSSTIRALIHKTLNSSGYTQVQSYENGLVAYEQMKKELTNGNKIEDVVDLFILDIEMPQMDGLTLCRRLREEFNTEIPVVMFSSLIDPQMIEKCKQVGANDQITKPQIGTLVQMMDKLLKIEIK